MNDVRARIQAIADMRKEARERRDPYRRRRAPQQLSLFRQPARIRSRPCLVEAGHRARPRERETEIASSARSSNGNQIIVACEPARDVDRLEETIADAASAARLAFELLPRLDYETVKANQRETKSLIQAFESRPAVRCSNKLVDLNRPSSDASTLCLIVPQGLLSLPRR